MSPSMPPYQSVMRSLHLTPELHSLTARLLSPDELTTERERLFEFARAHADVQLSLEPLGYTASGRALIGWSLTRAPLDENHEESHKENHEESHKETRPMILSASQHHGPENNGASAALYFSYLLIADPRFNALLDQYRFVFFPQQNPDGLDRHGNLEWMSAPHDLERFVQRYQYDPRALDVEHGVPAPLLGEHCRDHLRDFKRADFKRAETRGLIAWIERALERGEEIVAYLSGHAWDLLNGPLFLISGSERSYPHQRAWIERVSRWMSLADRPLNPAPPLSGDYVLSAPRCFDDHHDEHDQHIQHDPLNPPRGFYQAPHFDDFQDQQESSVMYSTLAYVEARAPEAVVVVLEPPIVDCERFYQAELIPKEDASVEIERLRDELLTACRQHDDLLAELERHPSWRPDLEMQIELEQLFLERSDEEPEGLSARLILEALEQGDAHQVWSRFFRRIDSGELDMTLTVSQLLVAVTDQRFATASFAARLLRLSRLDLETPLLDKIDRSMLEELYLTNLEALREINLQRFDPCQATFMYIAALLAAAGEAP